MDTKRIVIGIAIGSVIGLGFQIVSIREEKAKRDRNMKKVRAVANMTTEELYQLAIHGKLKDYKLEL
jgi:hypothetical protein